MEATNRRKFNREISVESPMLYIIYPEQFYSNDCCII